MGRHDIPEDQQTGHLERLAIEMESRGFRCRLSRCPLGRPMLKVVNPRLPAVMAEEISVETSTRQLWFWWGWGERLAPVTELDHAAEVIARVLADDRT